MKFEIKQTSIKYSSKMKNQEEKRIKDLEKEINYLESVTDVEENINYEKLETLKTELRQHYEKKTEGIMTRAKARWLKDGEKNSKYFLNMEKRNYINKSITSLITEDGKEINTFSDVLNEEKKSIKNYIQRKK